MAKKKQSLTQTTFLVAEYGEAIAWFTNVLGFSIVADEQLSRDKRWVVVSSGAGGNLLLAKADSDEQRQQIGKYAGGRVAFFLQTDDFDGDYRRYYDAGVEFIETPREEAYGKVVQFKDLYGNKWDLIEPAN